MREMKLVRGEVTITIQVATLVDRGLDQEEMWEVISELANNETVDVDTDVDMFDITNINLNEKLSERYENKSLDCDDWKDLLNKADKEEDEIIEIIPGQIGFNIYGGTMDKALFKKTEGSLYRYFKYKKKIYRLKERVGYLENRLIGI